MNFFEDKETKKIIYLFLGVVAISALILVALYMWYNNKLTSESELNILEMGYTNTVNTVQNTTTQTSTSTDKTVKNSVSNVAENKKNKVTNLIENKTEVETSTNTKVDSNSKTESKKVQSDTTSIDETQFEGNEIEINENAPLEFIAPVEGEIIKDFAEDTLVYSKTLDEWTTHLGIDIKADKTAVVKSAEEGVVESIKNDPRYGTTIIVSHKDGFKTVYANLLSTEFVKVGDNVEKGQTIGTVGQSASFESLDDIHLHFEIYKDGENVNPTMYLK